MSEHQIESLRIAIIRNLDNNGSVEELIRILENGVTISYIQEAENPFLSKNVDGTYTIKAEGYFYDDDMFLGVKGLGARIVNKLGINYHVTLMNKDVSLGTTIILDEMATLARAKYSNGSNNERFIFVDTSDKVSVMPVSESKSLSEVANQPWVGYVYYAENASKITRTVAKVGGPVSIGFLLNDIQNDYQMYSGRELVKAWGANLIPVATGLGGGVVGGSAGPVGFLLLVLLERHLGIIIRIESNLI